MIAFVLTLIFATSGFVGGGGPGSPNVISFGSDWGFIGGGDSNSIFSLGTLATNSFIGGGKVNNIASAFSTVAGGYGHTIDQGADFGAIAGGQANTIAINNQHSFIGGGQTNTINGNCSAILGGSGNTAASDNSSIFGAGNTIPPAMPDTHIIGSGITAVNAGALHINGLWANGIQFSPAFPLPQGTVFVMPTGSIPPFPLSTTGGVLWIM